MTVRVYAIEIDHVTRCIMSAGTMPVPEDDMVKDPVFLSAIRSLADLESKKTEDHLTTSDLIEIDQAVETWLGSDLMSAGLWDGEPSKISVRLASSKEEKVWKRSCEDAIAAGEQDAGDYDWCLLNPDTEAASEKPAGIND